MRKSLIPVIGAMTAFLFVTSGTGFSVCAEEGGGAAGSAVGSAVTAQTADVHFEDIYQGGEEFAQITATDAEGDLVWYLETEHHPAAQLMQCSDIGIHNGMYYYVDGGTICALDLADGSLIWENTEFGGASAHGAFDEDGMLYVTGYYHPDLFVVDVSGNTIYRAESLTDADQWPYQIDINGDILTIYYEFGGSAVQLQLPDLTPVSGDAPQTGSMQSELHPASVTASSELEPYTSSVPPYQLYTYYASYIDDGNPDTAWNEGVPGDGTGEYLELAFPQGTVLTGGVIWPGFYSTEELFYQNNAPACLEISSGGVSATLDLGDAAAVWQPGFDGWPFTLDREIVSDGIVRVTIADVRPGNTYDDTCVSELVFTGKAAGTPEAGEKTVSGTQPSGGEENPEGDGNAAEQEQAETELRSRFEEQNTAAILYFLCDDYDRDGTYEAFVVTERPDNGLFVNVWFTDGTQVTDLTGGRDLGGYEFQDSVNVRQRYMVDTGTQKFYVWENSAGGSGSLSYIFGVRGGVPYEPALSGRLQSFQQEGNEIVCYRNEFGVGGGHTYVRDVLGFDPASGEIME